jgi:non-specific serine/threonine protein kinase
MSPEQLRGEATDARSDIFSFGVLLYECLTGQLPFRGETSIDILHAILRQPPTPVRNRVPEVSPQWEQLIERCLAKAPDQRFPSTMEVVESLSRISTSAPQAEKSVAVLYFENLSGAKEDEYFRDGMTEDVITELLKIKGLQVFPRATVLAFRDKAVTAREVGHQLNAAYVLSGSLRRAGNRLRITAQLVDTRTDFPVWAERYDREMKDVFEVQDEIARSIAEALRIQLSPQEKKILAQKPTGNLQAYDFYLRGRNYARRENLDFALQMFEHAIKLDPEFALAHAGLASACGKIYEIREQHPRWIEKGLAACDQALAVDSQLPEGLAARARVSYAQRNYDAAVQYAQQAIERKPDCEDAYTVLARAYFASGRFEEAAALVDRALEASGDDYNAYIPLLTSVERLGQTTQAQKLNERLIQVLKQQLELVPEDVRARILLANRYAELGNQDDAARELETAVALRPNDGNVLYNAACTYGIMQKKAEALEMFHKAVEAGYSNMDWASRDPDLTCLHGDSEFQRVVENVRRKG